MKRSMVFEGVAVTLLLLLAFLTLYMVLGGTEASQVSGIAGISFSYAGSGNMLYVFSTDNRASNAPSTVDHIQAIDAGGRQAWDFSIPKGWEVSENCMPLYFYGDGSWKSCQFSPSVASGDGVLYVCLKPAYGPINDHVMNVTLMAISDGGRMLWTLPLDGCAIAYASRPPDNGTGWADGDVAIKASGNRVYVFHDFNETIVDSNGTVLWNVANVSDPAAVDEKGYIYLVKSRPAAESYYPVPDTPESWLPGPSSAIDAYYPNGTLYWENYTSGRIQDQPAYNYYNVQSMGPYTMPVYHDGLLYAPTGDGIAAFYPNGTSKWEKVFSGEELKLDFPADLYRQPGAVVDSETMTRLSLYGLMPFDSRGNVYMVNRNMVYQNYGVVRKDYRELLLTLDSNGNLVSRKDISNDSAYYQSVNDGIGYDTDVGEYGDNFYGKNAGKVANLTDLQGGTVRAYDIESGKELWSYNIRITNMSVATIDLSNVRDILVGDAAEQAINDYRVNASNAASPTIIGSGEYADMTYGNGTVYVNFQECNYEYPVIFGKSKAAYAEGIYAIADNGSLLWYTPARARDHSIRVTQNGTVFYQTPDGRIGVTNAGIAAGFTLTAAAYLFLRFFCLGAVARAKARLNKNENRARVLAFIAKDPGSTLIEVSDGTGMNPGTVRYHLFILGMNHKIVSCADGKFIRYFTNSNTYSRERRLVISLFRRDAMGKILGIIARKPGLSNVDIAGEAGLPESITSRYLKELAGKGVVRNASSGRERAYSIADAYGEHVADAVRRLRDR